jgi:hypothetical protein
MDIFFHELRFIIAPLIRFYSIQPSHVADETFLHTSWPRTVLVYFLQGENIYTCKIQDLPIRAPEQTVLTKRVVT